MIHVLSNTKVPPAMATDLFAAVLEHPGETLQLAPGNYVLQEPLFLDRPITIIGSGYGTVIYPGPGCDGIVVSSSHVRIADLRVCSRGGEASQKSRHGIVVEGQPKPNLLVGIHLERVECWEHGGDGFRLGCGIPHTSEVVELTMVDCKAGHNAGHGVYASAVYEAVRIAGLSSAQNGLSGATFDQCGSLKLERSYFENNWDDRLSGTMLPSAELVLDRCGGATLDALNLESYRATGIVLRNCVSGRLAGGAVMPSSYGMRPGIKLQACRGWEIGPLAISGTTVAIEFDAQCVNCEARKIEPAWGAAPVITGTSSSWSRNVKVTK